MNLTLKIWRQANTNAQGKMETYPIENVSPDMSFLEMMDVLNEQLINKGIDPRKKNNSKSSRIQSRIY